MLVLIIPIKADDTVVDKGRGDFPPTPNFLCSTSKNKKGKQRKKSLQAETIKSLSPRSKCHCFSNGYCFILECLGFK